MIVHIRKIARKIIYQPKMFFSLVLERVPFSKQIKALMSDRVYIKHIFRLCHGYELNLKHPQTFSEKLQWLKLYNHRPEYIKMVDKYEAKKYVSSLIGEKYIIPTLGVYKNVEEIDWQSLPNQFVLKCTHDSGGVIICKDKSLFDIEQAKCRLRKSLRHDYYLNGREWPYKGVPRRIIAEKYIATSTNGISKDLFDYKFFCFNGKVQFFKIDFGRFSEHRANYYSREGVFQDFGEAAFPRKKDANIQLPDNLELMIKLSETLSKGEPFLRVDFYDVNGNIYFGELTFFPSSGFGKWDKPEADLMLGRQLQLPSKHSR